ncbi:hypothetical protein CUMW_264970 [Citrus unshiu]|uniref:Uncharacterized protein n=1 Tax=Citrus unshiu TaxID=55188 RepID=A0A2H5QV92_CITUN|nr:hypothetical protein CUMW_264970 [Citrus unshiu]
MDIGSNEKFLFFEVALPNLEALEISDINVDKIWHYNHLPEIISGNRADEEIPNFAFSQLTTLRLEDLPKLRYLYLGMHTSEWPALEILLVYRCDKLNILAVDLSQNNENDQLGIPAQQPLLPLEKV